MTIYDNDDVLKLFDYLEINQKGITSFISFSLFYGFVNKQLLLLLLLLLLPLLLLSSLLDLNAKKCWLIIKPEREQAAREVFRDAAINVLLTSPQRAMSTQARLQDLDRSLKNMLGRKQTNGSIKSLNSQISPYHSLKQAIQPSFLVCGTVGNISLEHYRILLTKPLMPVWTFMLEVFGRDRDLHSSTFRCVTLMQTLTET